MWDLIGREIPRRMKFNMAINENLSLDCNDFNGHPLTLDLTFGCQNETLFYWTLRLAIIPLLSRSCHIQLHLTFVLNKQNVLCPIAQFGLDASPHLHILRLRIDLAEFGRRRPTLSFIRKSHDFFLPKIPFSYEIRDLISAISAFD
jgi:hypothetical protein